jgi:hypothetical protein
MSIVGGLTPMSPSREPNPPVENPAPIDLDLLLIALIGVGGRRRRRKILSCTQTKIQQEQTLRDYAQQGLSVVTRKPQN